MKVFKVAAKLGLEVGYLDNLMRKQTKALAMKYTHDDAHFLVEFLG